MPRRPTHLLVDNFIKESSECGEVRLIAGIDKEPSDPHPNAIFYIRMVSKDMASGEPCRTHEIWLNLNEMTRLSVLMNIASRFWVERLEKGESYSEERIKVFLDEYKKIKESLRRMLPKET